MNDLALKQDLTPPKGFRKPIPVGVKLLVVIQGNALCASCGQPLGSLGNTEFDHTPAVQLRCWDVEAKDTTPASNDPSYIIARHVDCHLQKTSRRKGESKLSKVGGDTSEIAKLRRLEKDAEAFRKRLLAKDTGEDVEPKAKSKWPSRPFERRPKKERGKG